MNDELEDIVIVSDPVRTNYTLDEIADKVAELALEKVLAKLEQLKPNRPVRSFWTPRP